MNNFRLKNDTAVCLTEGPYLESPKPQHGPWISTPNRALSSPPVNSFNAWERSLIESCPASGCGVHDWCFDVLKMLVPYCADDEKLFTFARSIFDCFACRHVDDGEIRRQMGNARRFRFSNSSVSYPGARARPTTSRWPLPNIVRIEEIVRLGPGMAQLIGTSPIPIQDGAVETAEVLEQLFPGNPLVCCSKTTDSHATLPLRSWKQLNHYQFIVPSPMSRVWGKTGDGRPSQRTLVNTGPRRHLVIEFDFKAGSNSAETNGSVHQARRTAKYASALAVGRMVSLLSKDGFTVQDMCAALIDHLSKYVAPAMVVHSGGKSLHAWFYCANIEEKLVHRFMRYAVSIGADFHTWNRCQFVRMPGGLRDNGTHQKIVYFDPEALS